MNDDVWYCAEGVSILGPFTFNELASRLSSNLYAAGVLVWRPGFSNWVEAHKISELSPYIKFETSAPPAMPFSFMRDDGAAAATQKRRSVKGSLLTISLIVIVTAGVRYFNSTTAPRLDEASAISGTARDSFVSEGMTTCMKKQESDPDAKSLSLSSEVLSKYCSCYMNSLADLTTYGDLKRATQKTFFPAMQNKINTASANCATKMQRSLLGGG